MDIFFGPPMTGVQIINPTPTESCEVKAVVHVGELLSRVAVNLMVADGHRGHVHQHWHQGHTDNDNPCHAQDEGDEDELKTGARFRDRIEKWP